MIGNMKQCDCDCREEIKRLLESLNSIGFPEAERGEILQVIAAEVGKIVDGDHIFLSLYDKTNKHFKTVAWRSRLTPGDAFTQYKFMGDKYLNREPVIIRDLAYYNHRLSPAAARLGLKSMIGVPIIVRQEVVGALEAYSPKQGNFSDIDVELLTIYAKRAAVALDQEEQKQKINYLSAENELLRLLLRAEKMPLEKLLAGIGVLFKSALNVGGIAVFGVEGTFGDHTLQEVMTDSFPETVVSRIKSIFTREFLSKLAQLPESGDEKYLIKHLPGGAGVSGAKEMYIVPVVWKQVLYGLIIFYRDQNNRDGGMPGLVHFIKQITDHIGGVFDRRNSYANIQRISLTDTLTKLANRRLFDYALEREFKRVKRSGKPLSLLMIDIDFFKEINDRFGHVIGDLILEQIGSVLAENSRSIDIAARYGGEEFAIILPDTDQSGAMMIAERLREIVAAQQFIVNPHTIEITVSIGIATYDGKDVTGMSTPELFVLAADQALYRAKKLGRNLTIVWSAGLNQG